MSKAAPFAYCEALARVYTGVSIIIYDATNDTVFYPVSYWPALAALSDLVTNCYSGSCVGSNGTTHSSFSKNQSVSMVVKVKGMIRTHVYSMNAEFWADAFARCAVYQGTLKGCSAAASVDISTSGRGIFLDSITIHYRDGGRIGAKPD